MADSWLRQCKRPFRDREKGVLGRGDPRLNGHRKWGKVRNQYIPTKGFPVLAKITAKNQLTLPKAITNAIGPVEYFDVQTKDGQIVLTPVRIQRADAVRAKLAALDLKEQDVADAVTWARRPVRKTRK
jgi:hypothetical protein